LRAPRIGSGERTWRVVHLEAVDSTNEEARRRARAGDPGRLWIVADTQLCGRGRHGRSWVSPKGNLYATALLLDPCLPPLAPQLGFVAGVALARAAADLGAGARLKWPNDLIQPDGKCAGLLVEGVMSPDRRLACVVGIGVNCMSAPEDLGYPAAVLTTRGGERIFSRDLLRRLVATFDEAVAEWSAGERFASIRSEWLDRAAGLGQRIGIEAVGGRREGVFEGLDADGRLLFRGEGGIEAIETGDLWLLPAADGSPGASEMIAGSVNG
jgi:BirA family biotin operon repressor/biotin-[acetyl-CoA-carboxylase] ligase